MTSTSTTSSTDPRDAQSRALTLAWVEWGHICRVLQACGGNVSEAARLLGLHRRSLQRKLRRAPPG